VSARPLAGVRVAVTRPRERGDPLEAELRASGAIPLSFPLVAVLPPADEEPLRAAVLRLNDFDWLLFTSARAVRRFADLLRQTGAEMPRGLRIGVVGPATAAAVAAELGCPVDAMPAQYTGGELAGSMAALGPLAGCAVLWPRAEAAQEALGRDLTAAGADLEAPVAYRTVRDEVRARELAALMTAGRVDVVTLTSPSAAAALAEALHAGDAGGHSRGPAAGVIIAAIGATTAEAAVAGGVPVHVMPSESTFSALVAALTRHLGQSQRDQNA
jgi:uroporphyrinogen-III synthase